MNTPMQELIEHLHDVKEVGKELKLPPKGCAVINSIILTVIKTIEDEYIKKEREALLLMLITTHKAVV